MQEDITRLGQAASLLRAAYGPVTGPDDDSTWRRFVRVLMGIPSTHAASVTLSELLHSSALASPGQSAAASAATLVETLQPIPRGPQKSSVVRAVAAWWLAQFGDVESPEWTGGATSYRMSLRQIRGLGPATVDELLLFAAGLAVFPVDRTALRVAVRHGWLDLPVEDEEAQSFFLSGQNRSGAAPQELSLLLTKVGDAHCGRVPKCDGCPLQSMLPTGGPRSPESC